VPRQEKNVSESFDQVSVNRRHNRSLWRDLKIVSHVLLNQASETDLTFKYQHGDQIGLIFAFEALFENTNSA
jgi:hypothetical protein